MATALMGIDKTYRTLAWAELTLPQLEFYARRVAKTRLFYHVYNDSIKGTKYTPLNYDDPKAIKLIFSNSTLSPFGTSDNWYPPKELWLRGVLNWIPDRLGMKVFPWAVPFLPNTRNYKQWYDLTIDFVREFSAKTQAEKTAKKWKGGKSRRNLNAWIMDARKYEILTGDLSNEYRWRKRKEVRAASTCLHAALLVCLGQRKALPEFDAETLKYVRKADLRKLSEIISRSQAAELAQWKKYEAERDELKDKLPKLEEETAQARKKLDRVKLILAAKK